MPEISLLHWVGVLGEDMRRQNGERKISSKVLDNVGEVSRNFLDFIYKCYAEIQYRSNHWREL